MNAYTLIATPPILLLIARPELWLWVLAVAAVLALLAVGFAAYEFRSQRDEARDAFEHEAAANVALTAEVAGLERDNMRMAAELAEAAEAAVVAQLAAGKTPRALRSVPRLSDDAWFGELYGPDGEDGEVRL